MAQAKLVDIPEPLNFRTIYQLKEPGVFIDRDVIIKRVAE